MVTSVVEGFVKNAAIRAFDEVTNRFAEAENAADNLLGRLSTHWQRLEPAEKERVVEIVIATATTAMAAISALRKKKKVRKVAVKAGRKVIGTVTSKAAKKAKKR